MSCENSCGPLVVTLLTGAPGYSTGVPGPEGPQGPQGEQGPVGPQGIPGEKGDKGDQGIPGVKGDQGIPGVKGDQGEQGIPGAKGDQGIPGVKGDQGEQGIPGVKGDQGEQGIPGIQGIKGDKGDPGEQGIPGPQGPKGDTGSVGTVIGDVAITSTGISTLTTSGVVAGTFGSTAQIPVFTVDEKGRVTNATTAPAMRYARTAVVGVDAATIQGCIDLFSGLSTTNQGLVLIPPGYYAENLTLKPLVSLAAAGHNNGQGSSVRIVGNATFTGGATAAENTLQLTGLALQSGHATTPTLTLATTGSAAAIVHLQDCMVTSNNSAATAVGVQVAAYCAARFVNVRTAGNTTAGQGGTHVDLNGGSLYAENWESEYGTLSLLMRGTNGAGKPYAQLRNCSLLNSGSNVAEIQSATGLLTAIATSFSNTATTGNGINISAAGGVVGATQCVFTITAGASNYVVTGVAGSAYASLGNSYSNITGAPYETKIGASVAQLQYSQSYAPASGDLTGTYPGPTLAAITTAQANVGSATVVPRLTIDAKGRVTALSTVAISALTTAQLSGLATSAPLALATSAAIGLATTAARADHVHPLTTTVTPGTVGSSSVVPIVTVDAYGRITTLSSAAIATSSGASLTTAAAAALAASAAAGTSTLAARGDHVHPFPTASDIGAVAKSGDTMTGKLIVAATDTESKLNIGSRIAGSAPSTLAAGDVWLSNTGAPAFRDSSGPTTRALAVTSLTNAFTAPQTVTNAANATPVLTVTNTGSRESAVFVAQGTSSAVRITQTGAGDALVVEDSTNPDSTAFSINATGRVGIGVASIATTETAALTVDGGGIKFSDGSVQTAAVAALTTAGLASLTSPAFVGTPTAPTASAGTNTTQLATTEFVQSNAGDKYRTTSSSTATISNGTKTFTVAAGLSYTATQDVTLVYDASNHMHGTVVSYSDATLVVDVAQHSGSGTYSAWVINVGGLTSAAGALLATNNLSDVANAGTSLTNLGGTPTTRTITAGAGLTGGGDLSADRTLALTTQGTAGTFGSSSVVPVLTLDDYGRVASVTTAGITGGGGAALTTSAPANLALEPVVGIEETAARADHQHAVNGDLTVDGEGQVRVASMKGYPIDLTTIGFLINTNNPLAGITVTTLGGDLEPQNTGIANATVVGIRGAPVQEGPFSSDSLLKFYGNQWVEQPINGALGLVNGEFQVFAIKGYPIQQAEFGQNAFLKFDDGQWVAQLPLGDVNLQDGNFQVNGIKGFPIDDGGGLGFQINDVLIYTQQNTWGRTSLPTVPSLSDTAPQPPAIAGNPGTSIETSRADHVHPVNGDVTIDQFGNMRIASIQENPFQLPSTATTTYNSVLAFNGTQYAPNPNFVSVINQIVTYLNNEYNAGLPSIQ